MQFTFNIDICVNVPNFQKTLLNITKLGWCCEYGLLIACIAIQCTEFSHICIIPNHFCRYSTTLMMTQGGPFSMRDRTRSIIHYHLSLGFEFFFHQSILGSPGLYVIIQKTKNPFFYFKIYYYIIYIKKMFPVMAKLANAATSSVT